MSDTSSRTAGKAVLFAAFLLAVATPILFAQSNEVEDRFGIHGYLTQAYTESSDLPILGITTTGRSDYRLLVLQTRYKVDDESEVVVQMRHRHFGDSPLTAIEPELTVSWAYYQQRVGPVRIRVGRVPYEQGIYSEIRFVGTLVPFFRAPLSIYPEGIEALDGAAFAYRTPTVAGGWSLDGSFSAGSSVYQDVAQTPSGPITPRIEYYLNHVEQIWLNTPIQGVRLGGSVSTFYNKDSNEKSNRNQIWVASLDGTFDRFFVRAEHDELTIRASSVGGSRQYAQTGVKIFGGLSANYQYEFQHFDFTTAFGVSKQITRDRTTGLLYAITPNLYLKAERHLVTGFYGIDKFLTSPGRTYYNIASISVTF